MPVEFLISALVTLVVVVDPIGLVPAFLAMWWLRELLPAQGTPRPTWRELAGRFALLVGTMALVYAPWLDMQLGYGASLSATLVWRIRSSIEVFPWSTCPSSATTGGLGAKSSGASSGSDSTSTSSADLGSLRVISTS